MIRHDLHVNPENPVILSNAFWTEAYGPVARPQSGHHHISFFHEEKFFAQPR